MNSSMGKVYDCAVIGGGVIGCFAARELCKYRGDFVLLEAGDDVAVGTTKANSGIVHAGFDAKTGTYKTKFNVAGARLMKSKCEELEVPYTVNGALVIAHAGSEKELDVLKARGDKNGVDTEIISGDAARHIERGIAADVTAALYAPTSAIVSPYELCIACYENYIENGGEVSLNSRVTAIKKQSGFYEITAGSVYRARTVINAAGLFAADISAMAGAPVRELTARRGQYMLLDKTARPVSHTVFEAPTKMGKGVLVAPTCHGNTLIGPNAEDVDDRTDVATTYGGLKDVFERACLSVPGLDKRDIITQFSGMRAIVGHDFSIGECEDGFYEAVGVCSPGLASSPAIGEFLALSVAQKLGLDENKSFCGKREAIPCFLSSSDAERDELIKRDARYGNIVCRCESITEGEIVEAIRRGAVDLDGIKRRVRAGMGRCQAGFCTPKLMTILAREKNIPPVLITKRGGNSGILR